MVKNKLLEIVDTTLFLDLTLDAKLCRNSHIKTFYAEANPGGIMGVMTPPESRLRLFVVTGSLRSPCSWAPKRPRPPPCARRAQLPCEQAPLHSKRIRDRKRIVTISSREKGEPGELSSRRRSPARRKHVKAPFRNTSADRGCARALGEYDVRARPPRRPASALPADLFARRSPLAVAATAFCDG
ncbi:hypothetical protein EVAR_90533_1 [Eumeta japonica]|uniref:Uncharacterized protein n=1 Tax=Eumeta variegata TaxID=151549 RepID=A0A4C1XX53_EUMVA|nr:hypothetical protein EVAR_90533_1 [Eumeta japonica]